MTKKQSFILSEIIVYIVAHALNFVYIITIAGITPQKKLCGRQHIIRLVGCCWRFIWQFLRFCFLNSITIRKK